MRMNVAAFFDSGDALADVMAVFYYGVAIGDRPESDFMTDGNFTKTFHLDGFVALHNPTGQHLIFLDSFDNDDADGILFFMNEKMRCSQLTLPFWRLIEFTLKIVANG